MVLLTLTMMSEIKDIRETIALPSAAVKPPVVQAPGWCARAPRVMSTDQPCVSTRLGK